jgi:hypothetical protein
LLFVIFSMLNHFHAVAAHVSHAGLVHIMGAGGTGVSG